MCKLDREFPPIKPLGDFVAEKFRHTNFDINCFPHIASLALENFKNYQDINLYTIGRWLCTTQLPPQQLQPYAQNNAFGEPPITLYWDNNFVIDAYMWHSLNTSIHDHAFRGAFCVVQGSTLHVEYHFKSIEIDEENGIKLGELERRKLELLHGPQDVVKILPESGLIHSTSHLEDPTITLCIRTMGESFRQYTYYAPSLAISLEHASVHSLHIAWLSSILQLKEVDILYITGLVENREVIASIFSILYYASSEYDSKILNDLFLYFQCRFPSYTQPLKQVLERTLKFKGFNINKPGDKYTRLLCALLLSCNNPKEVIEIIKFFYPTKDPENLYHEWFKRAQTQGIIPYSPNEVYNEKRPEII